jgi:peptidoglycan/LPS O-acetylase OafA/YrhL
VSAGAAVSIDKTTGRILELDGLRGFAVLLVVAYHYAHPHIPLGWGGVDLFFVLSGFLISGILLDSRQSPRYYRVFYTRRAARIIPAYALLLGVGALLYSGRVSSSYIPAWAYLLFAQNWFMAAGDGLFIWSITWSLAIEEQFYITLAPLVKRFGERLREIAIGMIAFSVLARLVWMFSREHHRITICRLDGLGFGILCMLAMRSPSIRKQCERYAAPALCALGVGMIPLIYADTVGQFDRSLGLTSVLGIFWIDAFCAALVMFTLTRSDGAFTSLLRSRPLREAGKYSYFIYLFHQSFWVLSGVFVTWPLRPILAGTLTLASAIASWKLIESPLLGMARRSKY